MSVPPDPPGSKAPARRRPSRLARLLLALGTAGLVLAGAEAVLRSVYPGGIVLPLESDFPWLVRQPVFGWTNLAGYANESFSINEQSLRGPSFATRKPTGTTRILCLGDSRTFGIWLDRGGLRFDNDWPRLLGERLASHPTPVEVLNLGVIGYTTSHGLRQLTTRVTHLEPDVVILAMGMNDHVPSWNPALRVQPPRSAVVEGLLEATWSVRLIQLTMAAVQALRPGAPEPFTVPWVDLDQYSENLERIVRESERLGFRLLFFHQGLRPLEMGENLAIPGIPPSSLELLGAKDVADLHRQHEAYRRRLEEVARRDAVPLLDGTRILGRQGRPDAFGPYDLVHLSDEGAAQAAEALDLRLRELGWL